jgi:hypothetical protein
MNRRFSVSSGLTSAQWAGDESAGKKYVIFYVYYPDTSGAKKTRRIFTPGIHDFNFFHLVSAGAVINF